MSNRHVWLNLGGLGALIALLGLTSWQHAGTRAVPEIAEVLRTDGVQAQALGAQSMGHLGLGSLIFR